MIIHAYIMCYNEEELIEFTLRHYSTFCSRIFLLDNMSTDGCLEIARSFDKVTILRWNSGGKLNTHRHSFLKSNVYKWYSRRGGDRTREVADWIIACDMDELIYHPDIECVLQQASTEAASVIPTQGYNMYGAELPPSGMSITQYIRHGIRSPMYDKYALFDCNFDMILQGGCHPSKVLDRKLEKQQGFKLHSEKLLLLHYNNVGDRLLRVARRNRDRLSEENIKRNYSHHYTKDEGEIIQASQAMALHSTEVVDFKGRIMVNRQ